MTIDEAYRFVLLVSNSEQNGKITPGQFNLLAKQAQINYLRDRFHNEKKNLAPDATLYGYGSSQKSIDDISPFIVKETISLTQGIGDKPVDYLHIDSATLGNKTIDFLDHHQLRLRKNSHLVPPSTDHPIGCFIGDKMEIAPSTITSIDFYYLKTPIDPVWAHNNNVYDPGASVDWKLNLECHNELCYWILQKIGVNISHELLTQYSLNKESTGG